jgi:hypothetical protein
MPKRLLLLNAALVAVAALCALYVARQLLTPTALPLPAQASAPAGAAAAAPAARPEPGTYAVVATRNLFSPTRSDMQMSVTEAGPAVAAVRPILHGVVLREESPIAYLEDPSVKRVAGYRVGDSIVGGTVQTIAADHVVIARPEGSVDIRLRDPSKPRPAAAGTAAAPGAGGSPQVSGTVPPGLVPPPVQPLPPSVQFAPPSGTPQPMQPGRRPFPLLRRVPPGVQGDAPRQ